MILLPLSLYAKTETGQDALGNPITEITLLDESEGRFSSWTAEEIALDNRDVTVHNRKIITMASLDLLKQADRLKFEEKFYDVTDIKGDDLQRWRILVVNRFGSDAL